MPKNKEGTDYMTEQTVKPVTTSPPQGTFSRKM